MTKVKNKEVDFNKLKIKQITDYFDRAEVESLLSRHHPLGHRKAMGKRISYAICNRGEWVAVIVFDKAVEKNHRRETKIGWSKEQRKDRLKHIAINSRFLIVPEYQGIKNLASKVLTMATDRLSSDWLRHYGFPILAVETYVDPNHNDNDGKCYSAAGWENLGYSSGYEAYNQERTHSKWYFLKSLHQDSYAALSSDIPHALLTGIKSVSRESNNNYVLDASKFKLTDLQKDLGKIKDPRNKQGQLYQFVPLLSYCVCAVISGYTQYRQIADWISKIPAEQRVKFGLPGDRSPCESTIGNFLRTIDPVELQTVLTAWITKTYKKDINFDKIMIDGKAIRATSADPKEQKAFLNVFASELGIVIEHLPTKKGGGEKTAVKQVLKTNIDLKGKIVLADALHTDKSLISELKKKRLSTSSLLKTIKNL
jgi:hypothetical protein